MINRLVRLFIQDCDNVTDPAVREKYGVLSGAVGIVLNLLLSAGKFFAGVVTGSIAITADAFNNLSDAGSSVVTLVGFKLAGQKADDGHPFGHGRAEYLAGLLVSLMILLVGLELGKTSIGKILHPEVWTSPRCRWPSRRPWRPPPRTPSPTWWRPPPCWRAPWPDTSPT